MKILVIHGAGMDMRGKAHIDICGPHDLAGLRRQDPYLAQELSVEVEIFHSNIEGEVINRLFAAHDEGIGGAIINPSGYTRGYPALVAAISSVGFPTIEVHISNPARRGEVSEVARPALAPSLASASPATRWPCAASRRGRRPRRDHASAIYARGAGAPPMPWRCPCAYPTAGQRGAAWTISPPAREIFA